MARVRRKSKDQSPHYFLADLPAGSPTPELRAAFEKGLKIPVLDLDATATILGCRPDDIVVSIEPLISPLGWMVGTYEAVTISRKRET